MSKNSKIFIKNEDINSQFFENDFLNEIKIIQKTESNNYETVITENIINDNNIIKDEIFEIPNSNNQINDNEQIDDPRDSSNQINDNEQIDDPRDSSQLILN